VVCPEIGFHRRRPRIALVRCRQRKYRHNGSNSALRSRFIARAFLSGTERSADRCIVRANMASELKPDQRMTDEEMLSQIPQFVNDNSFTDRCQLTSEPWLLAGNLTTSSALSWGLLELSRNPSMQDRLRTKVLSVADDQPNL